jgi:hypothetical protein
LYVEISNEIEKEKDISKSSSELIDSGSSPE